MASRRRVAIPAAEADLDVRGHQAWSIDGMDREDLGGGAPLVVLGAPVTIDADAFRTADGNIEASLKLICEKIHAYQP